MDLVLWRHAEAEEGVPDFARRLTSKGEKQAHKMAQWLRARLVGEVKLLVSPALRAQQTAQALGLTVETRNELAPGAAASRVLRVAGWPHTEGAVIVVGHQPTLGQVAAVLLSEDEADWEVKKGAAWWFRGGPDDAPELVAAITPKLV